MTYSLSATKLQAYSRCPRFYALKYHQHLPSRPIRPPLLGKALHDALAEFHSWPGWRGLPSLDVMHDCWIEVVVKFPQLTPTQQTEGWTILQKYFDQFISPLEQWQEPVAVEGRLDGRLHAVQVEFKIIGRYDRLERLPNQTATAQLHLIDYKTSKTVQTPKELEVDLQLGLYQMAITQRYGAALAKVSHIYLRSGDQVSFETRPEQKALVQAQIEELAHLLVSDQEFEARPGEHCRQCDFQQYCPAVSQTPEPIQEAGLRLQLSLL